MPYYISRCLFVLRVEVIALSVGINRFSNIAHLVLDTSHMGMRLICLIIYLNASFQALKGICEVSLVFVNGS